MAWSKIRFVSSKLRFLTAAYVFICFVIWDSSTCLTELVFRDISHTVGFGNSYRFELLRQQSSESDGRNSKWSQCLNCCFLLRNRFFNTHASSRRGGGI